MYCPNCGKQNEEDAKFCAHCGADTSPAEAAQPEQPAPTAVPPQPTEAAAPTPAPPTPQAAPTPAPAQPAAPPVAQPAAPPPTTVPPAPTVAAGEPAKKGTSCWLIGCGILLVLAILGGIGTCVYVMKEGGEVAQDLQQEIQSELQDSGLIINEGGDDGGSSSSDDYSSDDATVSDAPAAAVSTVKLMFDAWAGGDADAVKSRMTAELADENDDSLFSAGYKQASFEFTGAEEVSSTEWAFIVEEEFRNFGEDNVQSAVYRLRVTEMPSGWKISSLDQD